MSGEYNLYNLEASFRKYLAAVNKSSSTLKNYLSDLRHFLGWFTFYLKSKSSDLSLYSFEESLLALELIKRETVQEYKDYLCDNQLPLKTVNRRLSTLRKFCSFCIEQGWLKENPAKELKNQVKTASVEKSLIKDFNNHLSSIGLDKAQKDNILSDVREFLVIS